MYFFVGCELAGAGEIRFAEGGTGGQDESSDSPRLLSQSGHHNPIWRNGEKPEKDEIHVPSESKQIGLLAIMMRYLPYLIKEKLSVYMYYTSMLHHFA